ncbi:MAG: lytic transglycosylase domain-containing protein [Candidatus Levyibacteriota bacterium]
MQGILAAALPLLTMLFVNNQAYVGPQNLTSPQILSETAKQNSVWIVKEKDTIISIASNYYGNKNLAVLILKDNPWIQNPNLIEKGWKIKIRQKVLGPKDLADLNSTKVEKEKLVIAFNAYLVKTTIKSKKTTSINTSPNIKLPTSSSNYEEIYKEAGDKYGVPWQILYGLHLTETGQRDGAIYNHQGSGARGPMQFMPGTFGAYAVDGDGDGAANIDNAKDAIHTAANYMAKHGSIYNGLRSYGGNTPGTLAAAKSKGFSLQ